ncbi:MAG: O-methyltransferase [candidate division Zixibacteria bacterium]|nr:O-methyltransferase [candidate division Zixibacteria bacterium]
MPKIWPLLPQGLDDYLLRVAPEREPVLQEMEALAKEKDFPIIGPLVGRFLYQLAHLTKARRILELGSGYGYSAFWFARAIGASGRIFCTEGDEENARRARDFFKRGRIKARIEYRIGDALKLAAKLPGKFDIILCDIDKWEYPAVVTFAEKRLKKGGVLVTDNLLWSAQVLDENPDKNTQGILEYTQKLYASKSFFTTILPLRDGVSVSIRL